MSIEALKKAREALQEIAFAGMSGSGQESEEGMRDWHALHIKELCAGEEPVYQLRYTDGRFPAYWTELTELDYQHRDPREGCEFRILYPASTVAALKARVAELETALTRIDEAREALRSKK